MSVPRGTLTMAAREARLSVRIPTTLKTTVRDVVRQLQARGLGTSESELVELLVEQGIATDIDTLDQRLRRWRAAAEARA